MTASFFRLQATMVCRIYRRKNYLEVNNMMGIYHFNEAGLTEVPWTGEIVGVHNTFLKYWHGAGVLGAIGFVALFAVPARLVWRRMKKSHSLQATYILTLGLSCLVDLFI